MNPQPWLAIHINPQRVWSRVNKMDGQCWPWLGRVNGDGYGQLSIGNTEVLAHRAAYFIANSGIFLQDCIRHTCDNPRCCNPEHLVAGTHADNMADMKRRGRRKGINIGVRNGRAKLTNSSAIAIRRERESGAFLETIAKRYGVSISTIARVCKGENWK